MRYHALATDFDGTLAHDGFVAPEVIASLEKCRTSGRRLILVTGRELSELREIFTRLDLFDLVVVENGATLFNPQTDSEQSLAPPPPPEFIRALKGRGISPLSIGQVIVATYSPHENAVLEVIRDLGLELQVIFNKGSVMVLPTGVNKATGLMAALASLKISPHNIVAVGDAENDHALLSQVELGVAVANSVPLLAERADWVTQGSRGDGVIELIESLTKTDFRGLESKLRRHDVSFGQTPGLLEIKIPTYEVRVAACGLAMEDPTDLTQDPQNELTEIAELMGRIADQKYQTVTILPRYVSPEFFKSRIPNPHVTNSVADGIALLDDIHQNVIFIPPVIHPVQATDDGQTQTNSYSRDSIVQLLQGFDERRRGYGRPHWILVWDPVSIFQCEADWKILTDLHVSLFLIFPGLPDQIPEGLRSSLQYCLCFGKEASKAFRRSTQLRQADTTPELQEILASGPLRTIWSRAGNDLVPIQLQPPPFPERSRLPTSTQAPRTAISD